VNIIQNPHLITVINIIKFALNFGIWRLLNCLSLSDSNFWWFILILSNDLGIFVRFQAIAKKECSLLRHVQIGFKNHQVSYSEGNQNFFPEGKVAGA
jgi:hypothetical protein